MRLVYIKRVSDSWATHEMWTLVHPLIILAQVNCLGCNCVNMHAISAPLLPLPTTCFRDYYSDMSKNFRPCFSTVMVSLCGSATRN